MKPQYVTFGLLGLVMVGLFAMTGYLPGTTSQLALLQQAVDATSSTTSEITEDEASKQAYLIRQAEEKKKRAIQELQEFVQNTFRPRPLFDHSADGGLVSTWMLYPDGAIERLTLPENGMLADAVWSPDGDYAYVSLLPESVWNKAVMPYVYDKRAQTWYEVCIQHDWVAVGCNPVISTFRAATAVEAHFTPDNSLVIEYEAEQRPADWEPGDAHPRSFRFTSIGEPWRLFAESSDLFLERQTGDDILQALDITFETEHSSEMVYSSIYHHKVFLSKNDQVMSEIDSKSILTPRMIEAGLETQGWSTLDPRFRILGIYKDQILGAVDLYPGADPPTAIASGLFFIDAATLHLDNVYGFQYGGEVNVYPRLTTGKILYTQHSLDLYVLDLDTREIQVVVEYPEHTLRDICGDSHAEIMYKYSLWVSNGWWWGTCGVDHALFPHWVDDETVAYFDVLTREYVQVTVQ